MNKNQIIAISFQLYSFFVGSGSVMFPWLPFPLCFLQCFSNERLEYHGFLWFGNGLEFLVSILHASWLELLDIMVGISGS
mgnify:CR=1 FL=1